MTKPTVKFKRLSGRQPVIVQILPALVRGGVERGTVEMAQAIQAAGGHAVVISSGGPLVRHIERCGGKHIALPVHAKNPLRWPGLRRQLKTIFQAENADIVHVRSRVPAWLALTLAKSMGIATISTVHSRFTARSFLKRRYNAKLLDAEPALDCRVEGISLIHGKLPQLKEARTVNPCLPEMGHDVLQTHHPQPLDDVT